MIPAIPCSPGSTRKSPPPKASLAGGQNPAPGGISGGGNTFESSVNQANMLTSYHGSQQAPISNAEAEKGKAPPSVQPLPLQSTVPLESSSSSGAAPVKAKTMEPDPTELRCDPDITVLMKTKRVFQRFLVRSPHIFFAMAATYVLLSGMGKENLADSATTFVGLGATVFCLARAIFREIIPQFMLRDENNRWKWAINVTWTGFITVMFTSAVWKLPGISAVQGLIFLGVTFGGPYYYLSQMYPDTLDQQESFHTLKHGNKSYRTC